MVKKMIRMKRTIQLQLFFFIFYDIVIIWDDSCVNLAYQYITWVVNLATSYRVTP